MTLFVILCIITKSQIIAAMAQEVERILGKDEVTSSTLVSSSKTPLKPSASGVRFFGKNFLTANFNFFAVKLLLCNSPKILWASFVLIIYSFQFFHACLLVLG